MVNLQNTIQQAFSSLHIPSFSHFSKKNLLFPSMALVLFLEGGMVLGPQNNFSQGYPLQPLIRIISVNIHYPVVLQETGKSLQGIMEKVRDDPHVPSGSFSSEEVLLVSLIH
jgi:hypothetical protein